jgi:hypothetical protein
MVGVQEFRRLMIHLGLDIKGFLEGIVGFPKLIGRQSCTQ